MFTYILLRRCEVKINISNIVLLFCFFSTETLASECIDLSGEFLCDIKEGSLQQRGIKEMSLPYSLVISHGQSGLHKTIQPQFFGDPGFTFIADGQDHSHVEMTTYNATCNENEWRMEILVAKLPLINDTYLYNSNGQIEIIGFFVGEDEDGSMKIFHIHDICTKISD